MVHLINHTTGTKWKTASVQRARKIINERLPQYEEYETRLVKHVCDIGTSDEMPMLFTYSILVDGITVWSNNDLF